MVACGSVNRKEFVPVMFVLIGSHVTKFVDASITVALPATRPVVRKENKPLVVNCDRCINKGTILIFND